MRDTFGTMKIRLVFIMVLIVSCGILFYAAGSRQEIRERAATSAIDYTQYVNLNQQKQVFMRYPLGRIGLWSRAEGEIADSVTRNIRLYPLVDQMVGKDASDWRGAIVAHPSETDIAYSTGTPAKGSTVALTVTPNVSIYKYHFNGVVSFGAVGITLGATANYHGGLSWTSSFTVIDTQTVEAILTSGGRTTYYYIKSNVPGTGSGSGGQGYLKFGSGITDVIVAVALSQTSMAQAQQYFASQFGDFNFASASQRLKDVWNAKLGKIDVQNADSLTKQQLYTGLYTVYANIVNATDGSPYAANVAGYGSPLLTIGSSIGWAYIGGGYFRAAFDQGRSVYYLLTLIDPQVMTDILHTYQAQYDHDHVLLGNWDPYTPTAWTDQQWGFWGGMFSRAQMMGVTGVDYVKAKNAIADTFGNPNNIMAKSGYLAKGYIPADSGVSNYISRALDWSTDVDGLAKLSYLVGDTATYTKFSPLSRSYVNNWDNANKVFRAKNSNGSWAALGNGGFFEGTAQTYGFDVPHDILGLSDLYGDTTMTSGIASTLSSFASNFGLNDYVPQYAVMPVFSNSPSTAQNNVRTKVIPLFNSLNMWEDSGGGDMYYTHNAGELVLDILGLYPYQSPGAAWVINSPAVSAAVIHGIRDITIQANNNSSANIYISGIQVNGRLYPSHIISGKTLVSGNTTLSLAMAASPSRIGSMYVTGSDGEILAADTDNATFMRFQNYPVGAASRVKLFVSKQPFAVFVNGTKSTGWVYNAASSMLDIKGLPAGTVLVTFGPNVTPPQATVVPPLFTPTAPTSAPTSFNCLGSCPTMTITLTVSSTPHTTNPMPSSSAVTPGPSAAITNPCNNSVQTTAASVRSSRHHNRSNQGFIRSVMQLLLRIIHEILNILLSLLGKTVPPLQNPSPVTLPCPPTGVQPSIIPSVPKSAPRTVLPTVVPTAHLVLNPTSSQPSVKSVLGVNNTGAVAQYLPTFQSVGISSVRVFALYQTNLKAFLATLAASHIRPLLVLDEATSVNGSLQFCHANKRQTVNTDVQVVQALLDTYGSSYDGWFEFGNEPNTSPGNCGYTAAQYAAGWNAVIPQLKAIAPNAKFGGPVLPNTDTSYISAFLQQANPKPDFVSWHLYAGSYNWSTSQLQSQWQGWGNQVSSVDSTVKSVLGHPIPLLITEWNYAWDGGVGKDSRVTPLGTSIFAKNFAQQVLTEFQVAGITASYLFIDSGFLSPVGTTSSDVSYGQVTAMGTAYSAVK